MKKTVTILGTISVVLGITSALLCLLPNKGILFAIMVGFLGLLVSNIYIFLNTRHQINKKLFSPGLIGLLLSSTPVLFILFFILKQKFGF
ncbi:MAG: hypothetical protein A3F72_00240 [Bacteroidetes bacterium RIFCSPLOWO2_12_FULL_35_15]|nr:MAG: hypothetical protein A3F72_00240 [Bacteroidetes bacterium RIFCSPLOWO2_12_FULL_35_15]